MTKAHDATDFDVLIIGGGINGVGIARDLSGRGLKICLCEKDDLGGATSSSSTKLFHGGLRYLEFFEFKLVREALLEREHLLNAMPHISWPLRFIMPFDKELKHANPHSATSRLLRWTMPWLKGRRPAWVLRAGLFLYDRLASNSTLPKTRRLRFEGSEEGAVLQARYQLGFEYSDGWVDDARLVILNARDAKMRGADIRPRTKVQRAIPRESYWQVELSDHQTLTARAIINAAGPWASDVLSQSLGVNDPKPMRRVRGSHIVTKKLYSHEKAYFLQQNDGRIIFVIPYERDFTLIGTTEVDHLGDPKAAICSDDERDYLLNAVNKYFRSKITAAEVIWSYSGVRPLIDDEDVDATSTSRDYEIELRYEEAAPLLNIYGGKITTYRRLAEDAAMKITEALDFSTQNWTRGVALPGGEFQGQSFDEIVEALSRSYLFVSDDLARRLIRSYGRDAWSILGEARKIDDLGRHYGHNLYQKEVDWLRDEEWAQTDEDILWRRSKLGLYLGSKLV